MIFSQRSLGLQNQLFCEPTRPLKKQNPGRFVIGRGFYLLRAVSLLDSHSAHVSNMEKCPNIETGLQEASDDGSCFTRLTIVRLGVPSSLHV
jgi:hypothetical protein